MEHTAVISVIIEVYPSTGNKCTGKIVNESEMANYGIKRKQVLTVKGTNKHECLEKIKKLIGEFK